MSSGVNWNCLCMLLSAPRDCETPEDKALLQHFTSAWITGPVTQRRPRRYLLNVWGPLRPKGVKGLVLHSSHESVACWFGIVFSLPFGAL